MLTWVIGSGGLLGGAVSRVSPQTFIGSRVPWTEPEAAVQVLESNLSRFVSQASHADWSVLWAAGCGVVGSSSSDLQAETNIVERFVSVLRRQHPAGNGAFFLASSAGGIYAGSTHPPFSESTRARPVSAYGRAKLRQEELAVRLLSDSVPVVIGRLSNLYGPGQNLAKPQGLISQLCLAAARRCALNLFVPMDTLRDYLYADDAAVMITSLVSEAVRCQPAAPVIRNLASERPTPVSGVVRVVLQIARRPVLIALGTAPASRYQVRDLRVVSCSSDDIASGAITPLPVGVKNVYEHTLRLLRDQPYGTAWKPSQL
jgi:UDP-glucose 4-epimerase